jgi:uncharacterized membrane protein
MPEAPSPREFTDAELELLIERHWQASRPLPELPAWLPLAMRLLPWTLLAATIINGLIGVVAILTPLLAAAFGSGLTDPIYTAYSFICPQRPSHTFFLAGHPMAFEQRDLSMHLGFALVGLLFLRVDALRRPLPHWLLAAGLAPMLVDVALSTLGWLPATGLSRTWTGALAAFAVVWWAYPRFDAMLERARAHVERAQARRQPQPDAEWFVLADGGGISPRTNAYE